LLRAALAVPQFRDVFAAIRLPRRQQRLHCYQQALKNIRWNVDRHKKEPRAVHVPGVSAVSKADADDPALIEPVGLAAA
jgi:hypothetical protein